MTGLPSVEYELAVLNAFIAAIEREDAPYDDQLEAAQDHAHAFRTRLETPVRIAFTGFLGSRKSSLINLLTGQDVLPDGPARAAVPAIIVRHSATEKTIAGWWDQPSQEIAGLNLEAALALNPDIVSLEIDCDVLKDLWLISISGLEDKEQSKKAIFALMRLADVVAWCNDVHAHARPGEREVWRSIPARLQRNSLLIHTRSDLDIGADITAKTDGFNSDRINTFGETVTVAPAAALQALRGETSDPETQWARSGADQLVSAVMIAAIEAREGELEKVRRGIAKFIAPAQQRLDAHFGTKTIITRNTEPVPVEVPSEVEIPPFPATVSLPPVAQTPAAPEPAAPVSVTEPVIWQNWLGRITALHEDIQSGDLDDNAAFIETAQLVVDEFHDFLSDKAGLAADAGWLIDEFERANDLLILLQFETANDVAADAARILVQLSDSLQSAGV